MVGKSNKFDFSNRSKSGVNLARVIGDAFIKELDKAKKDATRQANKLRKQGNENATVVDSSKDISVHIIDLKVPSKDLSDDGIRVMVKGMTAALEAGTRDASLSLQHINLRDNGLTMHGVRYLYYVICPASEALKTLNLSNNALRVETPLEALQFETLLIAIRTCNSRCLVDLSGNQELGWRAWEIFARVFALQSVVRNPTVQNHNVRSSQTAIQATNDHDNDDEEGGEYATEVKPNATLLYGEKYLPILNIADTGLDDAGALWLSFFRPDQIVTCVTDLASTTMPGWEDHNEQNARIEWNLAGPALGKDGLQLLRWIEDIDAQQDASSSNLPLPLTTQDKPRRASGRHSTSISTEYNDVIALRHKIQRHIIHHSGARRVQLWKVALLCVTFSRNLALLASDGSGLSVRSDSKTEEDFEKDAILTTKAASLRRRQSTPRVIRITNSPLKPERDGTAPTTPLTDVSNMSSLRNKLGAKFNEQSLNTKTAINTLTITLSDTKLASSEADNRFRKWQQDRFANKQYADDTVPCRLPYPLFHKIFKRATAFIDYPRTLNMAKLEQAYRWGQDRSTLATEREWIKMTESAQILTLLDHVDCLSYVG